VFLTQSKELINPLVELSLIASEVVHGIVTWYTDNQYVGPVRIQAQINTVQMIYNSTSWDQRKSVVIANYNKSLLKYLDKGKKYFDQDCCLVYHVFIYTLIRKSEKLYFISFLKLQSTSLLECQIFCKFCQFHTIFAIEQNNDLILFPKWDTTSFVQQFTHCSTTTIDQTDYNHNKSSNTVQ